MARKLDSTLYSWPCRPIANLEVWVIWLTCIWTDIGIHIL